jgi:hypothetical protein
MSKMKPWSKTKIRRVWESIHAGGYVVEGSRAGCVVRLSDSPAGDTGGDYLIPSKSLPIRHKRWLGRRLIGVLRHWLGELEGVREISGSEARELTRWCTRWSRARALTATERRGGKAIKSQRIVYGAGYLAERSRRGWVVSLNSVSGRLWGHYLVPFRAFGSHQRAWNGDLFVDELRRALVGIPGVRRISVSEVASLLRWN